MNGGTEFVLPPVHVRSRTIRGALTRAALPAVAAAFLLAGCGSGGGSAAATASSTSTAGLSAFQACLKQHGVNVSPSQFAGRPTGSFSPGAFPSGRPTGSFSPGAFPSGSGRPRPSFTGTQGAAFQACAKYAPAGFGGGGGAGAISASALAAFKSCMSSKGVKVTGSTAGAVLAQLRNSTGKTATAFNTCRVLLQPAAPSSPAVPTPSS